MKEPENEFEAVLPDPYCSYCGRDLREHSEQDFKDCALKSGGEVSDDGVVIVGAHFKGEDPDPAKRAARRRQMRREMTQAVCACGKTFDEHSKEEIRECADKQRDIKLKEIRCSICDKLLLEHSHAESVACSEKDKAAKRASSHEN